MSTTSLTEKEIFSIASSIEEATLREAYLQQVCGEDAKLRRRIDLLLTMHAESSGFLSEPADGAFQPTMLSSIEPVPDATGTQIGPYKIREQLGEGGFGVVYVAEQMEPVRRKVALKIIKPGMDTKEVIARFEAERQALAMMAHSNIAKVLDGGTTENGRPYFVMELVSGIPITEFCDQQKLSTRERLELFVTVCEAVQHAHMKGIIHRDLKPSNVMVELHDVKAVPKVIDFGIAKATNQQLTQHTIYTQYSQLIGTPLYMSPEQAQLSGLDIDTRSDVYSLGVLLYELLTGVTPFDKDHLSRVGIDEMRRIIREDDPPKPSHKISTLNAEAATTHSAKRKTDHRELMLTMQRELDWIVMKALEKDRTRRYESASDLADDIRRYLDDEPVLACPPTWQYQFKKYLRKHRTVVTASAVVTASMVLGTAISLWQMLDAQDARDLASQRLTDEQTARAAAARNAAEADHQRNTARANLYLAEMRLGWQDWNAGNTARLRETLAQHIPGERDDDHRSWEWHYLKALTERHSFSIDAHEGGVRWVKMNKDETRLASGGDDGLLRIWDASNGELISDCETGHGSVRSLSWSPDGQRIATVGRDEGLRIWNSTTMDLQSSIPLETELANSSRAVEWSPDGTRLAVGGANSSVRIFSTETGELTHELRHDFRSQRFPSGYPVMDVSWHPNSLDLAVAYERDVVIWDAVKGSVSRTLSFNVKSEVFTVNWSPNGERLAAAVYGHSLQVFDTETWQVVAEWTPKSAIQEVRWHPNSHWLAAATRSQRVRIWDADTGREVQALHGHTDWVNTVDWCQNGAGLISGSRDGTIKKFDLDLQQSSLLIPEVERIAWSSSEDRFATSSKGRVEIWDISNSLPTYSIPGVVGAWSPDSQQLAVLDGKNSISIWNVSARETISTFRTKHFGKWANVRWSSDGNYLALTGVKDFVVISAATGNVQADVAADQRSIWSLALSEDGNRIATVGWDHNVKVWSLASLEDGPRIFDWPKYNNWTASVAFSPDGNQVVAGGWDQVPRVWDVITGEERLTLTGHSGAIFAVDWSPDGKRISSAGFDGDVKLWDAETGREVLTLNAFQGVCHSVEWSPDGLWLWATNRKELKLWSASPETDHIRNLIAQQKLRAERELANGHLQASEASTELPSIPDNHLHSAPDAK